LTPWRLHHLTYDIVSECQLFLKASGPKIEQSGFEEISVVRLNTIESDFLTRLSLESWTSPPVFDHGLLDQLVREKYVTTQATGNGIHFEISNLGRAEILRATCA
jgi:hypothetical protein